MNNILNVKNEQGVYYKIIVVDIIEDPEEKKQFICYKLPDTDNIMVSELVESENEFSIKTISSKDLSFVETILLKNIED